MIIRNYKLAFLLNVIITSTVVASMVIVFPVPVAGAGSQELAPAAEYRRTPLLNSDPHGRLNLIVTIKKLFRDGITTSDWYFYDVFVETVPGRIAYDSGWATDHTWAYHKVFDPGTYRWLVCYSPTTTTGEATQTVSLTVASEPSFTYSYSYTTPDVEVLCDSDLSEHRAAWQHDIDPATDAGKWVYYSEPGFAVKTSQNTWSYVDAWYKVKFRSGSWPSFEYEELESGILYLDAYLYGDSIPPEIPLTPWGETSGYRDKTYEYSTSTVDFDDDYVQYQFDWGDGSTTTTPGWYASGATASASHSWSSLGTYNVRVRAQDETYTWSGWSQPLTVNIVNRPPYTPSAPSGPTSGYVGTTYWYNACTTDPDPDDYYLWYQFDWGDGSTTTTSVQYAGYPVSASHSWSSPGTYNVTVRATDLYEWSGWSQPLTVNIRNPDLTVLAEDQYGNSLTTGYVWIDGQYVGRTGSAFTVTAGTHTVRVSDFWESGNTGHRYCWYTYGGHGYWEDYSTANPRAITVVEDTTIVAHFYKKYCPGDANGDRKVSMSDVILCQINMGDVPPKPPECDLNGDGKVSITDVIIASINLGKTYQDTYPYP